MALIPALVVFAPGTKIKSAEANSNFDAIKTAFNNTAVLTDVAKTINVAHTFNADILFTDATFDIGKAGLTRPRDIFASRSFNVGTTPALIGQIRLPNNNTVSWRNAANSADLTFRLNAADLFAMDAGLTVAGVATATSFSGPLTGNVTGNVTGNLTGTVLTAAQGNITSLGTLTSLVISGTVNSELTIDSSNAGGVAVRLNGTSAPVRGAFISFAQSSVVTGYIGTAGAIEGTTSNNMELYATNSIVFVAGGAARLTIDSTGFVDIPRGGSGSDTLRLSSTAIGNGIQIGGDVDIYRAGANQLATDDDFLITGPKRLYLDGGGDTYILESSANTVDLYAGGGVNWRATIATFALNGKDFVVDPTKKLYLDSGFDTYIDEVSANAIQFVAGGVEVLRLITPGTMTLPSAGIFGFGSRAVMQSPADGQIMLTDNAGTNFTYLYFGGVTVGYPMLKRVGAGLALRTGNDVSDAALSVSTLTGNVVGNVTGNLTGTILTASQTNITAVGTLGSLTVSGALSAGSFTVPTAAQANITSLGTLTSLTVSGDVTMTAAASRLIPGVTSFSHRNNANSADNLLIADSGLVTIRNGIVATAGTGIIKAAEYQDSAGLRLLNARKTGWAGPTGTQTRTTFDTATVNVAILAEHVKALIDDLTSHGIIGA